MKTQLVCQKCGKPLKRKRKTNLCFECYSKRKLDSKYKLAISNGLKKFNSENCTEIEPSSQRSGGCSSKLFR